MDFFIVTGSNLQDVSRVLDDICAIFDSRRLGNLSSFLGIEANRSSTLLTLSQSQYMADLL